VTRLADQPITRLKGVGPALAEKLERLGIRHVGDLLLHLPHRYEDRSRIVPLNGLVAGRPVLVEGRILESRVTFGGRRSLLVVVGDGSGFLTLRFFHFSGAQQTALRTGLLVRAFGEPRVGGRGWEMIHPEYRCHETAPPAPAPGLTPVYPTTRGLTPDRLRRITAQLPELDWPRGAGSPYPDLLLLHRPGPEDSEAVLAAARQRLALDELTAYHLVMRHRQSVRAGLRTIALPRARQLGRALLERLGFELTGAQRRVVREVLQDLEQSRPMLRLLQGDVGSGKTVIAAFAAVRAAENGAQTALMAPTEILAEQHFANFSAWLEPLGIRVALLTGGLGARAHARACADLADGSVQVAVGTHALFQRDVSFQRLALNIIDEQHRFGVHQRMALRDKGNLPHQLIMTATPIPRTLTMALYADMAVSVIDELPRGRQPIDTRVVPGSRRAEVIASLRQALTRGSQAYWVCPLIDEAEQPGLAAAETTCEALRASLPGFTVDLLHGRMKNARKTEVMTAFKSGAIQLLVATTVIEVGVDVPNATLMVIENPERMGLAQLHQLRGRVGRGTQRSACILLYQQPLGAMARARLATIRDSQDGFYIAERDLELRGPGELLGTRQTGEEGFRIADLALHAALVPEAIRRGDRLLAEQPAEAAALLEAWAPSETGTLTV
jgi:ATP-dependent DNA helicase RecG